LAGTRNLSARRTCCSRPSSVGFDSSFRAIGNGRDARLIADVLALKQKRPVFSWGGDNSARASDFHQRYIAALQAPDAHDIAPLLEFARS